MAELFKIAGARELDKVLEKLPRKMGEKVLRTALMAASKPMLDEMKRDAPVRSGESAKRFRAGAKKGRLPGFLRASIRRRVIKSKDSLAATVLVGAFGVFYAHMVEFGTKHSRAQPFVRPAFDGNAAGAIGTMGKKLGEQIEKETLKLAGSFAKSGLVKRRRRRR